MWGILLAWRGGAGGYWHLPGKQKDKDSEKNTQDENPAEGIFKEWQLKAMNRDKLAEICNEKGIEFTEDTTKGVLIGLILERQ